jgi:formate hydrogenlyase subunit 3/multisubunit Na+/H+ antiporter MnhD subunit
MSAPVIWIVLPAGIAIILFFLRRYSRVNVFLGAFTAVLLSIMAWRVPIGEQITLGPWSFLPRPEINPSLVIQGREFLLDNSSRQSLLLIYIGLSLWIIGSLPARTTRLFVSFSLGISALLTAALAVNPFLYASLFLGIAALLSIPLLSPPGRNVSRGVLRFFTFQTLGIPILLISGWLVVNVELNPIDVNLALRTAILLAIGFALVMAVFPFNTWLPILTGETNPYSTAFIYYSLTGIVILFGVTLLERFNWLQSAPNLFLTLSIVGVIMVTTSGVWSAFQRNLGRIFGYGMAIEIGLSLIIIALISQAITSTNPGQQIINLDNQILSVFYAHLLPRGLTLALWALSLSILKSDLKSLSYEDIRGAAYKKPLASIGLIISALSVAGIPLLAGFPIRSITTISLANRSPLLAIISLIGYGGLLVSILRMVRVLVVNPDNKSWQVGENKFQIVLLILGCVFLVLIGIFPNFFLSGLGNMLTAGIVNTP